MDNATFDFVRAGTFEELRVKGRLVVHGRHRPVLLVRCIRCKVCHLVYELGEGADVMDAALLVERRHRFGPHHLAARGADRGKRDVWVDHAKDWERKA